MTSQRQTDANRRNALLSTGPKTENGKQQSRGNAYRHGLTAQSLIMGLEDAEEYCTLEADIATEYDPQSMIERELTRRLASLLWRLRRATLIETGLFRIASEAVQDGEEGADRKTDTTVSASINRWIGASATPEQPDNQKYAHPDRQQVITRCFLHLADLPSAPFERVGRYEAALWRQFVQVLFAIDEAKRHRLVASRRRFTPHPPQW